MNKDDQISEEQLNAFVDGELDSEEKGRLFDAAEKSDELDHRLCQQGKLKELVKHAYRDVPKRRQRLKGKRTRSSMLGMAVAASMLLILGVATGLLIPRFFVQGPAPVGLAATTSPQTVAAMENYILHVVGGEPAQMKRALQQATKLLSGAEPGRPRQVEVVVNGQGLNLLRSDVTQFSEEIRAMASEGVVFYACSKAIERLEEKGVEVRLVPEAVPGYTALDRVVTRMKDGWQYVKI